MLRIPIRARGAFSDRTNFSMRIERFLPRNLSYIRDPMRIDVTYYYDYVGISAIHPKNGRLLRSPSDIPNRILYNVFRKLPNFLGLRDFRRIAKVFRESIENMMGPRIKRYTMRRQGGRILLTSFRYLTLI